MKLVGSKKAVRTPQFHRQKIQAKLWRYLGLLLGLAILIVAPVIALRSENLQITDVEISGNKATESTELEQIVRKNLSGYYLKYIPRSSTFLYPKQAIKAEMAYAYPRLANIKISLTGLHGIHIAVVEREPYALYCSTHCFFIDETGYIFAEAANFSDGVYVVYKSEPADADPLGTQFMKPDDFGLLNKFMRVLPSLNLTPETLIKKAGEYTLIVQGNTEVRWRADHDLEAIESDLASFLKTSKLDAVAIRALSYIDLRFDNKVFYK